jgi:hypothetical protein
MVAVPEYWKPKDWELLEKLHVPVIVGASRRGAISPTSRHKHQRYDSNGRIFHVNTLLRVSLKPESNDPRRPDSQTFVPPEQWQKIRGTICKHLKQFHTFQ